MSTWKSLAILTAFCTACLTARAQTHSLAETAKAGDSCRVQLDMKLAGEWRVTREGETVPIKISATAKHEYLERTLAVGKNGLPQKAARYYTTAQADIKRGDDHAVNTLRPECRLLVAQRLPGHLMSYCPQGPLTREEVEVTEHMDTLALAGLLPGRGVKTGETWKLANPVVQALCSFEGLIAQDLTCKLEEVEAGQARIEIHGTANGIDLGAVVNLTVTATCYFDVKSQRITKVVWKQKEERAQGPASPATNLETTTTVTRAGLAEQPKELSDSVLVPVPEGTGPPPAQYTQLLHKDLKGRFTLTCARDWQMSCQTPEHLTFRLLDQGNFIAQATVTPWEPAEPGKHLTPEEFKQAMENTPGWETAQILEDGELPSQKGLWTYRIFALGDLDGIRVLQNCYLVAGPNGEQVVLVFTMRQAQAERLGRRDQAMVEGIQFLKK